MFSSHKSSIGKKFQGHLSSNKSNSTCKLFVGNLATQTTSGHLQTIFQGYGHLIECVKVRERYGFVRFSTSDEAQKALQACNGLQLNGYPMIVEFAQNEILISPKSPSRIQTNPPYNSRQNPSTPINNSKQEDLNSNKFRTSNNNNANVNSKKFFPSTLNPDASSFQLTCSTSDYHSQSDRPSSRSSSSRSNCLSSSVLSVQLPLSSVSDDDDDELDFPNKSDDESQSSLSTFIGDHILNLYGSTPNSCKYFNGKSQRSVVVVDMFSRVFPFQVEISIRAIRFSSGTLPFILMFR